ncbi:MAG TPA: cytochrome c [Hypericibacter adhaerens]|jgi:mono/diheme cytochrome c family protein|nr:cytochrome c [Hypericibacter adhaerens]HWA41601.1 cytochrome c [Hypericibacter adhaerens]
MLGLALVLLSGAVPARADSAADADQVARGAYLFAAGGCGACHTDTKHGGAVLGGGVALDTPFGRFYTPNISADPDHGIGRWSETDFLRALQQGIAPDGRYYYPAFPYTAYSKARPEDLLAIRAYILSLPPVTAASKPHELSFPFSWRSLLGVWRVMNFTAGPVWTDDPGRDASWNRGGYLVEALGHCAECHTPRGMLGGLERDLAYSGTAAAPGGGKVPNITPDPETGIGGWSKEQVIALLKDGALPDFDYVGDGMGEVVSENTSKLTDEDRAAMADYLMSLPPIRNDAAKATQPGY